MDKLLEDLLGKGKQVAYTLVDAVFAWLGTVILEWLHKPDLVVIGDGDSPSKNLTPFALFLLSTAIRVGLPYLLNLLKNKKTLLVLCLVFASSAMAGEIVGPNIVKRDHFGEYTAKGGDKSSFLWDAYPRGILDMKQAGFGEAVTLVGPPGKYTLEQVEIGPSDDKNRPFVITKSTRDIEIVEGDTPPAPPGPNPPTPPSPPLPDGQYKLAAWAATSAKGLPNAAGVAAAFRSNASAAAAGTLKTPNDLLLALSNSIKSAGGAAWDGFRAALSGELNRQGFSKKPLGEFIAAANEVAVGLESLK